jgi:hypothetical protein
MWGRRLGRVVLLAAAAFPFISFAGMVVTSQNWFCNSCHTMNSYYDSWQASTHKEVACVECHISPGLDNFMMAKLNGLGQLVDDLLGRTTGKPSASVTDFSCTRSGCHDLEKVRTTSKLKGRYFFKHSNHLDLEYKGITTHCTTCHSHVKGTEHFEVNTNACVACHLTAKSLRMPVVPVKSAYIKNVSLTSEPTTMPHIRTEPILSSKSAEKTATRECKKCHAPPEKPVEYRGLKILHSEYVSYGASCESCHHFVTARRQPVTNAHCFGCHDFGRERIESVDKLHHEHSSGGHKVECFSCHGVIKHGAVAEAMRMDRFDCRSCHLNQHNIQQTTYRIQQPFTAVGTSTRPVTSRPVASQPTTMSRPTTTQPAASQPGISVAVTPMFMAHVDCTGCHVKPRDLRARPRSGAMVTAAVPEACDTCHKPGLGQQMIPLWQRNTRQLHKGVSEVLAALPPSKDPRVVELTKNAQTLLDLVRLDGSWGVHNPRYTQELLKQARLNLAEAIEVSTKTKANKEKTTP